MWAAAKVPTITAAAAAAAASGITQGGHCRGPLRRSTPGMRSVSPGRRSGTMLSGVINSVGQPVPGTEQAAEGLLHHVFGGLTVAEHDECEPGQAKCVASVQRGHRGRGRARSEER